MISQIEREQYHYALATGLVYLVPGTLGKDLN